MPWKNETPMNQKIHFISDYLKQTQSFTDLCEFYQISRKTGYKLVNRYKHEGIDGLNERSRQPHSHPDKTPIAIEKAIIEFRSTGNIVLGAKKIQPKLAERFPDRPPPSTTTINNILARHDLLHKRRKRRRTSPYAGPLKAATSPNDLWTTDFKGQFKLGSGQWCYPLTLVDQFSRYLLGCEGQPSVKTPLTHEAFIRLFQEYGLPKRIRSDNGVPFATHANGGLSRLSAWWIRLDIAPERIEPGKPQQNGHHERMHRTLKKYATRPACRTMMLQQQRFNDFRKEFNEQRPHESLNQQYPSTLYRPSERPYPSKLAEIAYPSYFTVRKVRSTGVIYWNNGQVYVTHILKGEWVGLEEVGDGIFDVYFSFYRIGQFDIRDIGKGQVPYWTIK